MCSTPSTGCAPTPPRSPSSGRSKSWPRARGGSSTPAPWMRPCTLSGSSAACRPPLRSGRCFGPRAPGGRGAPDARPIDAPLHGLYVAAMTDTLMVGVSGIRGIVGKDLTPENVARYAAAFGVWAIDGKRETRKGKRRSRAVVLGRDARTSGPMVGHAEIAGLVSVGCDVIDIGLTTTPTAQLAALHHRAAGGIILTASHNPIEWNALKFIGPDGIFLDTDAGARVQVLASDGSLPRADYGKLGQVTPDNSSIPRHVAQVLRLPAVAVARLRRRRVRVALGTVPGSGGAVMPGLLPRPGGRGPGNNPA